MATATGATSSAPRGRPGAKSSSAAKPGLGHGDGRSRRWPYAGPDQLPLLLSSLAITVGSFLPWVVVGHDLQVSGFRGGGLWTFYGASVGIAGALVRRRRPAAASAAVAGTVAVALATWQVLHLVSQAGFDGWRPGLGLVVVAVGGTIALRSAWRLGTSSGAGAPLGAGVGSG